MVIPEKFYSTRGTPLSAYHRIKDLLALGHEVEALTYAVGDPPPDLPIVVHRAAGPHFAADLAQGPSYLKIWFDALLLVHLVRLLRRGRFDALYAHEEGGFLCAMLLPWCRLPLIYDMHSSLPLQIRDWRFSDREWVVSAFRFVERFTLARSAAVVAISTAVAEAARSCAPDVPVEVIVNRFDVPTPVRPEEAARLRADLGIGASESVVLYAGSFVALQSLDLLIGAVPAVARAVPSARFVLVGGKPAEVDEARRLVESIGAADRVQVLPVREQAEIPTFLAAADVLVSPRIRGINPPGKLFSYLQSGRPVVATDRPVHNQILDRSCAILTSPDAEGLAAGIVSALTDRDLARRIVKGAEEILKTRYHPDRRVEAYRRTMARVEARRGR